MGDVLEETLEFIKKNENHEKPEKGYLYTCLNFVTNNKKKIAIGSVSVLSLSVFYFMIKK